jgi:hypothetical protein
VPTSRACKQCAIDRVRCSRGQPCKRCFDRQNTCWYPSTRRSVRHRSGGDDRSPTYGQQDTSTILNPTETNHFVSNSVLQASNVVGDCAAIESLHPVTSDTAGDPEAWTSNYVSATGLDDFNQPGLGALGVNWISPQYQDEIDWDAILVGFPRTHDGERQQDISSQVALETVNGFDSNLHQQPQQVLQPTLESDIARSSNDTASSATPKPTENIYYVDGTGARAPFGGRSHCRGSVVTVQEIREADSDNAVSPIALVAHYICPQAAYDNLTHHLLSGQHRYHFDPSSTPFPSRSQIQLYVDHYFENFHPIFPFIHKSTFAHAASDEWLLLLAVAAVGSRYTLRNRDKGTGKRLLTLLNAALRHRRHGYETGDDDSASDDGFVPGQCAKPHVCPSLILLQAGILNVLLLQHSGKKSFVERAMVERHYLVEACHSLELISRSPKDKHTTSTTDYAGHNALEDWLVQESEIRVGMMIWVRALRSLDAGLLLRRTVCGFDLPLRIRSKTSNGTRRYQIFAPLT